MLFGRYSVGCRVCQQGLGKECNLEFCVGNIEVGVLLESVPVPG